ncbi:MAG: NADH-quinone oxidoreductase subunit C [Bacteroidales bacterium]
MMSREELKEKILSVLPKAEFAEGGQWLTILTPKEKINSFCKILKETPGLGFDYLFCQTGLDFPDKFAVVYHLESTETRLEIVLKAFIPNKENPEIETVADIFKTAEFHEREIYDFFGIHFKNHPDMRRIFLDEISDQIGHPFRKDYVDEVNIIER